ncbi:hypothetical protein BDV23DRAFT_145008 [Aspergillus alliaceus]|uniref:Uncharacterized protein n=1 Tax=Petromyces alliaceus TaxID=209559 RepID=A0A5N7CMM6_PETAA|nr:hypothetical protein BDV23DRAFT_145008 [Aspergillus alliaceus]
MEVKDVKVVYLEQDGRVWSGGVLVRVWVSLKEEGVSWEDYGFGEGLKLGSRLLATEKAQKEAITDAFKRVMWQFRGGRDCAKCKSVEAVEGMRSVEARCEVCELCQEQGEVFRRWVELRCGHFFHGSCVLERMGVIGGK